MNKQKNYRVATINTKGGDFVKEKFFHAIDESEAITKAKNILADWKATNGFLQQVITKDIPLV